MKTIFFVGYIFGIYWDKGLRWDVGSRGEDSGVEGIQVFKV